MSISKKFFSALALVAIASSVIPANAQTDGTTVTGRSTNFVFCEGPANVITMMPTARYTALVTQPVSATFTPSPATGEATTSPAVGSFVTATSATGTVSNFVVTTAGTNGLTPTDTTTLVGAPVPPATTPAAAAPTARYTLVRNFVPGEPKNSSADLVQSPAVGTTVISGTIFYNVTTAGTNGLTATDTTTSLLTTGTSRTTSAQSSFDKNGRIFFARNTRATTVGDTSTGLDFNGNCQNTSVINNMPILPRHTTTFDLNGTSLETAVVSNVNLTNNVPTPTSTTVCVATGTDAVVNFVDVEKDGMKLVPYDLSDTSASAVQSGNAIRVTPPTIDFVGKVSMRVGITDSTMERLQTNSNITTLGGSYNFSQVNVNPSGTREANVTVTVEFSKNCPAMVSSMSSSMMNSSMMSSSMMSSMDSSMMSSSMKSSMMASVVPTTIVYVEIPTNVAISGKGMTIRTGSNN